MTRKATLKRTPTGKLLLPQPGDEIHLSKYGYMLEKPKKSRQLSLKKASKKHGTLKVLKRTNLIATLSKSYPENYNKLRSDVEFLKKEYKHEKPTHKSTKKSTRKSSRK